MKNKKAIELSINFIVIFILSIILFGFGIYFARMIMGGGTELTEKTFEEFDKRIGELVCGRGESVCINANNKQIQRTKTDYFPVTVKNDLKETHRFMINVDLSRIYSNTNDLIYQKGTTTPASNFVNIMPNSHEITLEAGESNTIPILVQPLKEAVAGQYSFDVLVYYLDSSGVWKPYPDDKPRKLLAKVI
ncbi:MAG: hypothetical protein N3D84_02845 [Candidatus Woesearchaeota archaeon]|nr:hypothetical protein [Candidatus Woesearchaeota archaeon]